MTTRFLLRSPDGQKYAVTGPFRIGRDADCEICLDNTLVSRIHASVWIDHDHLLLRDERSRNGTLLNGEPVAPGEAHYLHHGDELRIGDATFAVESDPPYPRPAQHSGLAAGAEPPPTAHLEAQAPAQPAGPKRVPRTLTGPAGDGRPFPVVPVVAGGCVLLVLLVLCALLGFLALRAGPGLLGPHHTPTPAAAAAMLAVARAPVTSVVVALRLVRVGQMRLLVLGVREKRTG